MSPSLLVHRGQPCPLSPGAWVRLGRKLGRKHLGICTPDLALHPAFHAACRAAGVVPVLGLQLRVGTPHGELVLGLFARNEPGHIQLRHFAQAVKLPGAMPLALLTDPPEVKHPGAKHHLFAVVLQGTPEARACLKQAWPGPIFLAGDRAEGQPSLGLPGLALRGSQASRARRLRRSVRLPSIGMASAAIREQGPMAGILERIEVFELREPAF